jgi:hypothetical protein
MIIEHHYTNILCPSQVYISLNFERIKKKYHDEIDEPLNEYGPIVINK